MLAWWSLAPLAGLLALLWFSPSPSSEGSDATSARPRVGISRVDKIIRMVGRPQVDAIFIVQALDILEADPELAVRGELRQAITTDLAELWKLESQDLDLRRRLYQSLGSVERRALDSWPETDVVRLRRVGPEEIRMRLRSAGLPRPPRPRPAGSPASDPSSQQAPNLGLLLEAIEYALESVPVRSETLEIWGGLLEEAASVRQRSRAVSERIWRRLDPVRQTAVLDTLDRMTPRPPYEAESVWLVWTCLRQLQMGPALRT